MDSHRRRIAFPFPWLAKGMWFPRPAYDRPGSRSSSGTVNALARPQRSAPGWHGFHLRTSRYPIPRNHHARRLCRLSGSAAFPAGRTVSLHARCQHANRTKTRTYMYGELCKPRQKCRTCRIHCAKIADCTRKRTMQKLHSGQSDRKAEYRPISRLLIR